MDHYCKNIEKSVINNSYYRKVIFTTKNLQLVFMCLKKGEEIGSEVHKGSQFIRIEKGRGICVVGGVRHRIKDGTGIVIPGGRRHNIINTGKGKLKLYSIYSPPEHPRNKKERNKIVE